jgi:hypothetical protein
LLIFSIVLLIEIIKIIINDFERLTPYGQGYLFGLVILFTIGLLISYFFGRKLIAKTRNGDYTRNTAKLIA